jgi:hypothetical protein
VDADVLLDFLFTQRERLRPWWPDTEQTRELQFLVEDRRCMVNSRRGNSHSFTYTVFMRNITLSVDEKVLAVVRRHAAERNSSVNALVRDYLTNLATQEDRADNARAHLRELSARSPGRLGKKSWTRDNLHDR